MNEFHMIRQFTASFFRKNKNTFIPIRSMILACKVTTVELNYQEKEKPEESQ